MGIKGIYAQLGSGQRVSLSKLTADSFKDHGRPLRLAVDYAIWEFQNQAAVGGTNPALRTLFFRLLRLLETPIQPIFVFDGPHKPMFKRNKRSGRTQGVSAAQAKRLMRLMGLPFHDAPGEAEAECALMQKRGIVDAVLSEDVDTIMFGCTRTLRNWSSEGKSAKTPTHVSLYDPTDMKLSELGLDREGMVLVALMSGGDYLPDGIPGCGVKVACEAAKAGFGRSLCRLKSSDTKGVQEWRETLNDALKTGKGFRVKHKALSVPEGFPNFEVLRYYTHPVVSPESVMDATEEKISQRGTIQLDALREFTREQFGWNDKAGAIYFMRKLAPPILVQSMLRGLPVTGKLQNGKTGRRTHFDADGEPELRMSYIPLDVAPIDLSQETEEVIQTSRNGLALNDDDDFEAQAENEGNQKDFDVSKASRMWVLEEVVKQTLPEAYEGWEEIQSAKTTKSPRKAKAVKKVKGTATQAGTIDRYVRVVKKSTLLEEAKSTTKKLDGTSRDLAKASAKPPPVFISSSPPRESSKPPTPSRMNDPSDWTSVSSQMTPSRTPKRAGVEEAIIIPSSPAAPAPPSPSPRPRATPASSQDVFSVIRSGFASTQGSKEVKAKHKSKVATKPTGPSSNRESPSARYKQMSMDMFTTKKDSFTLSQLKSSPILPPRATDIDSDWDEDLPPLSSMMPPISPSKRHKSPTGPGKSISPLGSPKKKLFVPRMSAVGYFKEVEVTEEERDERSLNEERHGGQGQAHRHVRYSDVSFIDLTQDE